VSSYPNGRPDVMVTCTRPDHGSSSSATNWLSLQ
jgi:hypothetical protein